MTMIEKVARALWKKRDEFPDLRTWEELEQIDRDMLLVEARAALTVLLEPSEGMVEAGNRAGFKASVKTVSADVFTAMIQAALSEEGN